MSNMLVGMWNVEVFEMWGRKIHNMQGQVMDGSPSETDENTGSPGGMENGKKVAVEHLG